jgi:hypothetical protein
VTFAEAKPTGPFTPPARSTMTANQLDDGWKSAWPDVIAFVSVLAVAWWTRARATDLVWSLWLSSLVVGYVIILWAIVRLPIQLVVRSWPERRLVLESLARNSLASTVILAVVGLLGLLFTLAFFTVHFVGFHYVHAGILGSFFPFGEAWDSSRTLWTHDLAMYREILRRYWIYLPAAFLAERAVFLRPPKGSITALPYRKVVRMHALIFFFAFAHFVGLDNFAVYAVVYAVYFFPWRMVAASPKAAAQTTAA